MIRLLTVYQRMQASRPLPELVAAFDTPDRSSEEQLDAARITRQIDLLMRLVYRDRFCMKRSLLHFHYLRRMGANVVLQFGVTKTDDGLTGHAWVEVDGEPYEERFDPRARFTRTYSYPAVDLADQASLTP